MPQEYQDELFEEYKKEKSKFEAITDTITQKRKRFFIYLPLENLVFFAIIFIMCLIVAFALGVERGKRFEMPVAQVKLSPIEVAKTEEKAKSESGQTSEKGEIFTRITSPKAEYKIGAKPAPERPASAQSAYTIQLASFRDVREAEREKDKLASKKINAFLVTRNNRYQLCVGGFENAIEAEIALDKFRKNYKGCFIRKGVR